MTDKPKRKRKVYKESPVGLFVHPWVNRPDTKFNEDGVFKAPLLLQGKVAEKFKEEIDIECEAYFNEHTKDLPEKERKKWSIYYPYDIVEDSDGNPTGGIKFKFVQNAKIKLEDGTIKDVTVGIYDSKGNDMHKAVYSGSEGRVMYAPRGIKLAKDKMLGVRLDFSGVQIKKLLSGGGGPSFGEMEDGYVDDGAADNHEPDTQSNTGGDY